MLFEVVIKLLLVLAGPADFELFYERFELT